MTLNNNNADAKARLKASVAAAITAITEAIATGIAADIAAAPPPPAKAAGALVLRTCDKNMQGYGGFQWPTNGEVSAPDWNSKVVCGNGLHGLLWGNGSSVNLSRERDAKWLVCEVDPATCIDLDGKVKFQTCNVIAVYDNMAEAITRIVFDPRYPQPNTEEIASGDYSSATNTGASSKATSSGTYSTAVSSGTYSKAISNGDFSKSSSSGDSGKASSVGDYTITASIGTFSSAASSGKFSSASSNGISSKASSVGDSSSAWSNGISSKASSVGDSSSASSSGTSSLAASNGDYSKSSSSGASGIAAACGCETWVKAGPLGCIFATEWVAAEKRYRGAVGHVGENGVKADTWYRCVAGQLVEK